MIIIFVLQPCVLVVTPVCHNHTPVKYTRAVSSSIFLLYFCLLFLIFCWMNAPPPVFGYSVYCIYSNIDAEKYNIM